MELAILAGLYGLIIGSFLNVCIGRLPNDESISAPRSYCPRCGTRIAAFDNIPLLSYLLLRGRCRYCHTRISIRYPIVEGATALSFFYAVYAHGPTWQAFKLCLFAAILIELMASDLETRILPDEFTLWGAALGLFLSPIVLLPGYFPTGGTPQLKSFVDAILGGVVLAFSLWSIGTLYLKLRGREGLGFGDVKLVLMTGAFLGLRGNLVMLILGSIAGSILGLAWIWLRRKDAASYELPYGLFLGAAAFAVAFLDA
jgi:leader peptidase (prepilin peptidase)/N-methyltransferase